MSPLIRSKVNAKLAEMGCFRVVKQRGSNENQWRRCDPTSLGDIRIPQADRIEPGDLVGAGRIIRKERIEDQLRLFPGFWNCWLYQLSGLELREARLAWAERRRDTPGALYIVMKKTTTTPKRGRPVIDEDGAKRIKKSVTIAASTAAFLKKEQQATGKNAGAIIDMVVVAFENQQQKKK